MNIISNTIILLTLIFTVQTSHADEAKLKDLTEKMRSCYHLGQYDLVQKIKENEYWIVNTYVGSQIITNGMILKTTKTNFAKLGRSITPIYAKKLPAITVKLKNGLTQKTSVMLQSSDCEKYVVEYGKVRTKKRHQELYGERNEELSQYINRLTKDESEIECYENIKSTMEVLISPQNYSSKLVLLYQKELDDFYKSRLEKLRSCAKGVSDIGKRKEIIKKYRKHIDSVWDTGVAISKQFKILENIRTLVEEYVLNLHYATSKFGGGGSSSISTQYQYIDNAFLKLKDKKNYKKLTKFLDSMVAVHVNATKDYILKSKSVDGYNKKKMQELKSKIANTTFSSLV